MVDVWVVLRDVFRGVWLKVSFASGKISMWVQYREGGRSETGFISFEVIEYDI